MVGAGTFEALSTIDRNLSEQGTLGHSKQASVEESWKRVQENDCRQIMSGLGGRGVVTDHVGLSVSWYWKG